MLTIFVYGKTCYYSSNKSAKHPGLWPRHPQDAVTIDRPFDNYNQEIIMVDRKEKRAERERQALEEYEKWKEASKAHWSHWRAWGSWFSWGSPVGLGLFFISLAITFAIFKYAIGL